MRRERVFGKCLVSEKGNEVHAEINFTHTAWADCSENFVSPIVAADLTRFAADYLLSKKEMERFTIVSESDNTVLTGIVTYRDEMEIELKITNVYTDVFFVKKHNKEHYQVG